MKVRSKNTLITRLRAGDRKDERVRVAFFDAKPYDRASFDALCPPHVRIDYYDSRLDEHTLENLLLNFLIDANVARERRAAAAKKKRR